MDEIDLTQIGLGKNESTVYLALLRLKTAPVKQIVKASQVYRRTVYDALKSLQEKGLVSFINMNKIRYFTAASPDKLISFVKQKEEYLKAMLPTLKKIEPEKSKLPNVQIFTGKKAFRSLIEAQVMEKEILGVGVGGHGFDVLKYYLPQLVKRAEELPATARSIARLEARPIYDKIKKQIPNKFDVRYLPNENFPPTTLMIWGNHVSMTLFQEELCFIVIKNKEISDAYKGYFEMLWKSAVK